MNLDKTSGQIIMSLCQEAGISRSELARRLGVTPSQISRIVNEETKTISSEILIAMTKEFGVSADYILGLTDKKAGNNSVDNPVIFHGTMILRKITTVWTQKKHPLSQRLTEPQRLTSPELPCYL